MTGCDFCKVIRKKLDKNKEIYPSLNLDFYENYKENFQIRDSVAICRGFNLCKIHVKTIKKDNKIRSNKGEDIPNSLELKKKLVRSDI